jgi:hypothetical protein
MAGQEKAAERWELQWSAQLAPPRNVRQHESSDSVFCFLCLCLCVCELCLLKCESCVLKSSSWWVQPHRHSWHRLHQRRRRPPGSRTVGLHRAGRGRFRRLRCLGPGCPVCGTTWSHPQRGHPLQSLLHRCLQRLWTWRHQVGSRREWWKRHCLRTRKAVRTDFLLVLQTEVLGHHRCFQASSLALHCL